MTSSLRRLATFSFLAALPTLLAADEVQQLPVLTVTGPAGTRSAQPNLAALRAVLSAPATFTAFVGSRAKMLALRASLGETVPADRLADLHAPAGLDIGAITPEEIALSILAQMVAHRRKGQRGATHV